MGRFRKIKSSFHLTDAMLSSLSKKKC